MGRIDLRRSPGARDRPGIEYPTRKVLVWISQHVHLVDVDERMVERGASVSSKLVFDHTGADVLFIWRTASPFRLDRLC